MNRIPIILVAVVGLALGFGAGWLARGVRADAEAVAAAHQAHLAQGVANAYIYSSILNHTAHGRQEKAERLLRQNFELALWSGDRAVREGATLSGLPEIDLGAERVVAYADLAALPPEQRESARRIAAAVSGK